MLNIIHLPKRVDRLPRLIKELSAQNITEYKLWDGIVDETFVWRGIRSAHQQIVVDAKNNNLPYVTIAEDDIKFYGTGAWAYYMENMPPLNEFDIYLGGVMNGEIMEDGSLYEGQFTGLTLYTMSNKFYDTFINIRKVGHIDSVLHGMGRFIVCQPMIVTQHGGMSDSIGKVVKDYDLFAKGRKVWKH